MLPKHRVDGWNSLIRKASFRLTLDAWIITSGYKEEAVSELIGEVVYKSRIKNVDPKFKAVAVGKWGNIRGRQELG